MSSVLNKNKIINGLIWKFLERGGVQVVQFIIQIILARILLPEDYGVISLITIFITIANVFVESGFNTALLQKKDVDEMDYSTSFIICLFIGIFLYLFLFVVAPFISNFYAMDELTPVVRVLSIILIIGAVNAIQVSKVSREFQFKRLFFCSMISSIISGAVGICMAYMGYGVWALVFQQILQKLIITIILFYTLNWMPKIQFSFIRLKLLFSFGSKLLVSNLINTIYNNVYGIIIGKIYAPEMLGFYNRADQFPNIIVNNINGSLQSVLLPAMSMIQDNRKQLKEMVRKSIQISSFLIFPMMVGMAACSASIIEVILTDKWLPCVPFLQLLCLTYALYPIHTANLQAINALGRSDIFLKLEIVKKVIGIISILISLPFGIYVMVGLQPIVGIISMFINAAPNQKLLNYSYNEQFKDILKPFLAALIMGGCVLFIDSVLQMNVILKLVFEMVLGIVIYIAASKLLKINTLDYILNLIKEKRN